MNVVNGGILSKFDMQIVVKLLLQNYLKTLRDKFVVQSSHLKHKLKKWHNLKLCMHKNWDCISYFSIYSFSIAMTLFSFFDSSSVRLAPFIRNSLPSCRNSINYSVRLLHLNFSSLFSHFQISSPQCQAFALSTIAALS